MKVVRDCWKVHFASRGETAAFTRYCRSLIGKTARAYCCPCGRGWMLTKPNRQRWRDIKVYLEAKRQQT
jgi:hypothetical protein